MKRVSIWASIGIALLCFGMANLTGAYCPSVGKLGLREMRMCFGGQIQLYPCKKTMTTCPDPGGEPATCQFNANTQDCWQCKMRVTSWLTCSTTIQSGFNCSNSVPPDSPYCGNSYVGGVMMGTCPSGACNLFDVVCGQQIGTVTFSGGECPAQ